jgi:hypothetical protein
MATPIHGVARPKQKELRYTTAGGWVGTSRADEIEQKGNRRLIIFILRRFGQQPVLLKFLYHQLNYLADGLAGGLRVF